MAHIKKELDRAPEPEFVDVGTTWVSILFSPSAMMDFNPANAPVPEEQVIPKNEDEAPQQQPKLSESELATIPGDRDGMLPAAQPLEAKSYEDEAVKRNAPAG